MPDSRDPHLEVLQNIWGEMKTINARVNTTNERLEHFERSTTERLASLERTTNERLERLEGVARATNERLESFERGVDARFAAIEGHLELHGRAIVKLVEETSKLNTRFDDFLGGAHGKEHDDLRARVDRLEKHTGLR